MKFEVVANFMNFEISHVHFTTCSGHAGCSQVNASSFLTLVVTMKSDSRVIAFFVFLDNDLDNWKK